MCWKGDIFMASDARIRYTKMVIKQQFAELLKEIPLKRVTVKEICDRAEINRATFYRYYNDPYDLMNKIEEEFLIDLMEELEPSSTKGIKEKLLVIMEKMKENISLYQALFSENGDRQFLERLLILCYKESAVFLHQRFERLSYQEQEYLYYFLANGCSGSLTQWVSGGMETPIDQMADFTEKLCDNAIRGL